jgi:hypothetical protein
MLDITASTITLSTTREIREGSRRGPERQQQAFRQQLPDDAAACRAE